MKGVKRKGRNFDDDGGCGAGGGIDTETKFKKQRHLHGDPRGCDDGTSALRARCGKNLVGVNACECVDACMTVSLAHLRSLPPPLPQTQRHRQF